MFPVNPRSSLNNLGCFLVFDNIKFKAIGQQFLENKIFKCLYCRVDIVGHVTWIMWTIFGPSAPGGSL